MNQVHEKCPERPHHQYLDGIPSDSAEAHNQRIIPQHFKAAVVLAPVTTAEIRQLAAKPSTLYTYIRWLFCTKEQRAVCRWIVSSQLFKLTPKPRTTKVCQRYSKIFVQCDDSHGRAWLTQKPWM